MIITPMENEQLQLCKECGSVRVKLKVRVAYGTFWYVCQKCGYTPKKMGKDIAEAIKLWNEMK